MADLLEHALAYAGLGLDIFPVHPDTKRPMAAEVRGAPSQHHATLDLDQIEEWWGRWPNALIGHRIAPDMVLLDIDPRHDGMATWAAIKAALNGDLPTTRTHYSGRSDGGGHVWFKRPTGPLSATGLDRWAKEHGCGQELAEGRRWTSGIDLLTHEHRYTILPPSPHPDTDRPYKWGAGRGLAAAVAPMPSWLADLIVRPEPTTPAEPKAPTFIDPDSIADWFSATHTFRKILGAHLWRVVKGDGDADGSEWVHPEATTSVSATVRHHNLFVYSTSTVFEPTEPDRPRGYTPFAAWALLNHAGDLREAGRHARELKRQKEGSGVTQMLTPDRTEGPTPSSDTPESNPGPSTAIELVELDHLEAFWGHRPMLGYIRDFARARRCSPWAMLGVVLARVASATPYDVVLPPLVGSHLSLNFYVCLVGGSGGGKDAAISAGGDALDLSAGVEYRTIGLGSGEGILDQFVEYKPPDKKTDEPGGVIQHNDAVLFTNPEIGTIEALKGRTGSTLMPMLRDAWMGSELGFSYANRERRLSVAKHHYRLNLILGAQPTSAAVLLDEADLGTPQRFLWLPVHDPAAPDEVPPVPEMPEWHLPHFDVIGGKREVVLPPEAVQAVDAGRLDRLRGTDSPGAVSGHALACQEKVSALLAIMDGRGYVTSEDWALAGVLSTVSARTRESAAGAIQAESKRKNAGRALAEIERKEITTRHDDDAAIRKACQRIKVVLGKQPEGMSEGRVRNACGGKHRDAFAEALDLLQSTGDVLSVTEARSGNEVTVLKLGEHL